MALIDVVQGAGAVALLSGDELANGPLDELGNGRLPSDSPVQYDVAYGINISYAPLLASRNCDERRAAAERLGDPSGKVRGKAALRNYFQLGLEKNPKLHFELEDVMWGLGSVVLYYKNQRGTKTGEVMELDDAGKVRRVLANYSG